MAKSTAFEWLMAVRIGESKQSYKEQIENALRLGNLIGKLPTTCSCGRALDGDCWPSHNIPGDLDCTLCFRVKSFIMFHEGRSKMKTLMDMESFSEGEDDNDWVIRVNIDDERKLMTKTEVYEAASGTDPRYMAFMYNPLSTDIRTAILMANRLWDPAPNTFSTYYDYQKAVFKVAKGLVKAFARE
jgi:hypothetical protein